MSKLWRSVLGAVVFAVLAEQPMWAGVFLGAESPTVDLPGIIVHPYGYAGTGGALAVKVCLGASAASLEADLLAAIDLWNSQSAELPNCVGRCLIIDEPQPAGPYVASTVLAHELGHCALGLSEINNEFEGGSGLQSNYTATYDEIAIQPGADGIAGTSDDLVFPLPGSRLIHWFRVGLNDPFFEEFVGIDNSNFTREIQSLPAGHAWAASGNKGVAGSLGYLSNSQSIMFGRGSPRTTFLSLIQDDLNTIAYAGAGLDEERPTPDDYSVELQFVVDCIVEDADIVISLLELDEGTIGECLLPTLSALPIPGQPTRHFAFNSSVSRASIRLNSRTLWDFSLLLFGDFETGDTSQWSLVSP